tara:strand:- start:691 stop:1017 length:327 start_codon:yes stop_codon:yes gene_type:complete
MIELTEELNPETGQIVIEWRTRKGAGYCATKPEAINDARICLGQSPEYLVRDHSGRGYVSNQAEQDLLTRWAEAEDENEIKLVDWAAESELGDTFAVWGEQTTIERVR